MNVTEFIKQLISATIIIRFFHWKTTSLQHEPLGDFYSALNDAIDNLVETYQGREGLLEFEQLENVTTEFGALEYSEKLAEFIEANRTIFIQSYIQNQIDTMLENLYILIYKLRNTANIV